MAEAEAPEAAGQVEILSAMILGPGTELRVAAMVGRTTGGGTAATLATAAGDPTIEANDLPSEWPAG